MTNLTFTDVLLIGLVMSLLGWMVIGFIWWMHSKSSSSNKQRSAKLPPSSIALGGLGCGIGVTNLASCIYNTLTYNLNSYEDASFLQVINGNLRVIHDSLIALKQCNEEFKGDYIGAVFYYLKNPGNDRKLQINHLVISKLIALSEFGSKQLTSTEIREIVMSYQGEWGEITPKST